MNMLMLQELPFLPLASLGVGGTIAGITLYFYHRHCDDSEKRLMEQGTAFRESQQTSEERFARVAQDFREIVERNTQALTMLTAMLGQRRSEEHG
jgi:hypothetical protein